jgi:Fuc2NAc and GlcNAc transferase
MRAEAVVVLVGVAAAAASWWLTGVVLRYALKHRILDVPGERSSHTVPTARGGGLAIAVVTLTGIVAGALLGAIPIRIAVALVPSGLLVAAIGWYDDRRHVSPGVRACLHFLAAGWSVFWLGGLKAITLGGTRVELHGLGAVVATIGVVWCINLYNFMDGIDGLAAVEAVSVGLIAATLLWSLGQRGLSLVVCLVAVGAAGFLIWNWTPARIFMGDVGSGLLGFLFGAVAVAAENARAVPLPVAMLLLGVFAFDATATLIRRLARGERWYQAHRSHAYQRAVQGGLRHSTVSLAVLATNAGLGALAWFAIRHPGTQVLCLLLGLAAIAVLYIAVERRAPMRPATFRTSGASGGDAS